MKSGICVAGNLLVDKINEIETFPKEGQLVKIKSVSRAVGGCVPNTAMGLKKLCPDMDVYALGRIGWDEEGAFLKSQLTSLGIDVESLVFSKDKTSFTEVMSVGGGERTFFTYPGASDGFGCDDVNLDTANYKMLHLGYFLLLKKMDEGDGVKLLQKAKAHGISTSIDLVTNKNGDYRKIRSCLPYVDNLIINEIEAGALAGMEPVKANLLPICQKLKEMGVNDRVIIHSPDVGVCLHDKFSYLPSYSLPEGYIKGSTGAGDAFCSGCLVGIDRGFSDEEILNLGSSNAIRALSAPDAVSGLTDLHTTIEFAKQFKRKNICL